MVTIRITLEMELSVEDREPITEHEAQGFADEALQGISNRLFGDGFLPGDVLVEDYTATREVHLNLTSKETDVAKLTPTGRLPSGPEMQNLPNTPAAVAAWVLEVRNLPREELAKLAQGGGDRAAAAQRCLDARDAPSWPEGYG